MKQILPELRQINKHLSFAKKAFTKGGFRHVTQYIDGLITLQHKTVRQISLASLEEQHHSAIQRVLTTAKFEQKSLEERYIAKAKYLTNGQTVTLILDDTLVEREGKHVEETQSHKDHTNDGFLRGHQFFTAIIHTPSLRLPLFPKLYSKNTDSKIDMARSLIDNLFDKITIHTIVFDSWYSDKQLINKCTTKGIKVVCCIKTNRKISKERGTWEELAIFSKNVKWNTATYYWIDEQRYHVTEHHVKLNGISTVKLLISKEWLEKTETWSDNFHLISTNAQDTPVQILRQYDIRWIIETYHRDIKQNLGFAKVFLRKKEGIVRHAIFVSLAYAILQLLMHSQGTTMTIGNCIKHVQDEGMNNFVRKIVDIDDKQERIKYFEEAFIRKTAQL